MKVLIIDMSNGDNILAFRKTFLSIINVAIKRQLDIDTKIVLDTETVLLSKTTKYLNSAELLTQLSSNELREVHTEIRFSIMDLNQAYHYTSNYRYPVITIGVGAELTDDFVLEAITSHDTNNIDKLADKYLSKCCSSSSALNSSQTSTDSTIEAAERAIFGTSKLTIEDLAMPGKSIDDKLQGKEE